VGKNKKLGKKGKKTGYGSEQASSSRLP